MSFQDTSQYTLNTGDISQETSRLTVQHDVFVRMTGTLLPPEIAKHVSTIPNPKIADVATGTGIWARSISALYPTARLDGYDFDTSKFPPEVASEKNGDAKVKLSHANILDLNTFPPEMVGQYDVVHVRLLIYALTKDEWPVAAKTLESLLKPGGWLLWEESGWCSWVSLPPSKTWYQVVDNDVGFARKVGKDILFPLTLEKYIQSTGMTDLRTKIHSSLLLERQDEPKEVVIRTLHQTLRGIAERGGYGDIQSKADADEMIERLRKELLGEGNEDKLAGFEMKWVWGQKSG
ncbi:hypothetical protein FKW77_007403 [Venturia effusa]|uniref:Methyltransferase domain-containing protein n=1 Tax=Venturia effusa TaxID=50376 RepID=A0A517L1L2_9PEZI|nr:hypothetical protein FKW77_007403 [Venturia effusa]